MRLYLIVQTDLKMFVSQSADYDSAFDLEMEQHAPVAKQTPVAQLCCVAPFFGISRRCTASFDASRWLQTHGPLRIPQAACR